MSDKDGMTPLLTACYEGHNDAVELLLEYDADIVWPPPPHSLTLTHNSLSHSVASANLAKCYAILGAILQRTTVSFARFSNLDALWSPTATVVVDFCSVQRQKQLS